MQTTEKTFTSSDGTELFFRGWLPDPPVQNAILLFHRGHEHSARWQETVESLALPGTGFFAWDQRGHGQSPGQRGDAPSVSTLAKDADCFARYIQSAYGIPLQNMAIIASSVGAVIATAWVHDFGPPIRGMVLAAPAFRVKLYVPFAMAGLRLMHSVFPNSKIKSYVKSKMLTHNAAQARAYDADPLIFRQISVRMLLDLYDTSTRLLNDAGAIHAPTLLLSADRDWVVKRSSQQTFFRRLSSSIKQMEVFPNSYHSLFHESNRQQVIDRTRDFLSDCFDRRQCEESLLRADEGSFTRTEYDLLRAPGAQHWTLMRAGLSIVGRLSDGIGLGWKTGFDSGLTLDYVYANKPGGRTPLGKAIDYFYLNAIGWRGIRVRRENLERALRDSISRLHQLGKPISILDIASGPGRYVLETLNELADIPASALLRDYQHANLEAARALAGKLKVNNVTIEHGNAFDRESLAAIMPRPTIAIVSGLYELFPGNAPVLESLRGIADSMDEGGLLIYTCQPWHPQVEFIARVLTNREGKPWIMRRRTQAEMDALVHAAGFEKLEQTIDRWGMFTVSIARRISR